MSWSIDDAAWYGLDYVATPDQRLTDPEKAGDPKSGGISDDEAFREGVFTGGVASLMVAFN